MTHAVVLDNITHHDLKIIGAHGAQYGDAVNEAPVFATEFSEVQREYPIYFRKEETGGFQAYALLGLDKDENLFLGASGWQGRYIPAMCDRGPFMIGRSHDQTMQDAKLMVDMDDPRVSRTEGEPLFLAHGGHSPRLNRYLHRLRTIHDGLEIGRDVFRAFEAAGLITQINIEIKIDEDTGYIVPDVFSIDREALMHLDGNVLAVLNAQGYLALAFHVVSSLGNIGRIIELKTHKRGLAA